MLQRFASFSSIMSRSGPCQSWLKSCSAAVVASPPSCSSWMSSSTLCQPPNSILFQQQPQISATTTTMTIRHRSKRSTRGLYDGKDVRFGNNVPFSLKKTRRRWNPNVQFKKVYSEVLDEMVQFHVTTSALRTIDKYGGLDNYLLTNKNVSTKG